MPMTRQEHLAELTCDILREAGRLSAEIPAEAARLGMAGLVREMNSYYSNLIEGHRTLPEDIERALKNDFSLLPKEKNNQLLHVAHIRTQEAMEARLRREKVNVYSDAFICWLHEEFYRHLPEELHMGESADGGSYRIEAGQLRTFQVRVGRHQPPLYSSLPAFLTRFEASYGNPAMVATGKLIACAAAHHRLMWIHPFGDGNGRVGRLQTHAALIQAQVDGLGLWTMSRGLARHRQRYYDALSGADQPRANDFDGRGNLSDRGLADFCAFFLETMLDQIKFMSGLLEPPKLVERIQLYIYREAYTLNKNREQLARLLRALLLEGELPRGRVPEIIGKKNVTAAKIIKLALAEGLIASPNAKGPLRIAFPAKVLDSYFPRLFLDLPLES